MWGQRPWTGSTTLIDYRDQQHFKAQRAINGAGAKPHRRGWRRHHPKVPVGHQIPREDKETVLADMTEAGMKVLLARGGRWAARAIPFPHSRQPGPRATPSPVKPGEERWLWAAA